MRLTFSYHSRLTCSFEKAPTPRTLTGTVTIRSTTYVTNTASESFPIATLTGSNGKDLQSGTGGYSISDKIALGVGLGLRIPTLLVLYGCVQEAGEACDHASIPISLGQWLQFEAAFTAARIYIMPGCN